MRPHHAGAGTWHVSGPHWDSSVIWDGWILMLPGVFVAAVLATALALNGPGEALWSWVRALFAPDPWRARWDAAVASHRVTALAFSEFECDLGASLRLPALADVNEPATGRFVDAFAEANALRSEHFPGPEYAQRFVAAVERTGQAWAAAVESAERKRDARFDPDERRLITQVETFSGWPPRRPSSRSAAPRTARRSAGSPTSSGGPGGGCPEPRPRRWRAGRVGRCCRPPSRAGRAGRALVRR